MVSQSLWDIFFFFFFWFYIQVSDFFSTPCHSKEGVCYIAEEGLDLCGQDLVLSSELLGFRSGVPG